MDDAVAANAIIQRHRGDLYGIKIEPLAKEISEMTAYNPGIVNQVFVQLQVQGYDSTSIIKTARLFLDQMPPPVLNQIAKTPDGSILMTTVYGILKCGAQDNQTAARCVKIQLAFKQTTDSTEVKVNEQPNQTGQPRQLSQSELDYYAEYNETNLIMYERNGSGTLKSTGGRKNGFNPEICWELPTSGKGFVIYNRDDLKGVAALKDKYGLDQIGTKETIEAVMLLAKEWSAVDNQPLQIGDISRPGGVNTPDHKTHNNGKIFDMRPLRNKAGNTPIKLDAQGNHPDYHRDLTKAFIRLARKLYPSIEMYFNDQKIYEDREFSSFVTFKGGHYDHLHVMFPGGKE